MNNNLPGPQTSSYLHTSSYNTSSNRFANLLSNLTRNPTSFILFLFDILMIFFLIMIITTIFSRIKVYRRVQNTHEQNYFPAGTKEAVCGANHAILLPILETRFNLRECSKQMILLEDHLNNPQKRCRDCCKKHMLMIEALSEEGAGLNGTLDEKHDCQTIAKNIRDIADQYQKGDAAAENGEDDPLEVAESVRKLRKSIMNKYF